MHDSNPVYWDLEYEIESKFIPHKNRNQSLSRFYAELGYLKRAVNVKDCGSWLEWKIPEDLSDTAKLSFANFCKDRLCVMCTWRRTLKIFGQVSRVMDVLEKDYQFIFLTLTIRNCSAEELEGQIKELQKGFELFRHFRQIERSFCGYFKALEITRNLENPPYLEYHPHLHCIIAVRPDYFTSKDYLSQKQIRKYWQQACKLDYDPRVDVRKIRPHKVEDYEVSLGKAVAEVAKYSVKSDDYLSGTYKQIKKGIVTLLDALTNKRLCSFGGVFKKVAHELDLDDLTDGDLVVTDGTKLRSDIGYFIVKYEWQIGFGYQRKYIYYEKENNEHDNRTINT